MANATGNPGIKGKYSASGGRLIFTRGNASTGVEWGENGSGIDNTWFGDTSGAYMKWDESADALLLTNADFTQTGGAMNIASASFAGNININDGYNISVGSGSGTQIATSSTQKLGFFGASPTTPIKFSVSAVDIASAMRDLGLMTTTSA